MPTAVPSSTSSPQPQPLEANIVDTLQSLIVAFVLAMTFRGFVTEGFVIPTGSMAPTLMGAHLLLHSDQTGISWPLGMDQISDSNRPRTGDRRLADPNLGPNYPGSGPASKFSTKPRMGDRILVLKCLYPFAEPQRYDVVVFKNPTDPIGDSANYIKRLIGLPNEQVWIADGDVFSQRDGETEFKIRRKPEKVQRAVWQMVHHSDFLPIDPDQLYEQTGRRYTGPPWVADGADKDAWKISGRRSYECTSATPTALLWNASERAIDDWTPYDMISTNTPLQPVSDVRVSAGIVATQAGFQTTFELLARNHLFEFHLQADHAWVRMWTAGKAALVHEWSEVKPIHLPVPGKVFDVEFWHVDQSVSIYLDGQLVVHGEYDWKPLQRLQLATGAPDLTDEDALVRRTSQPCKIAWRFEGSPFTLHRVRTDRDLFYRFAVLDPAPGRQREPFIYGDAFATNPHGKKLQYGPNPDQAVDSGRLGPDQFMMCGDNSQSSLDSRLWGNSHPLIRQMIDEHPFTVNRKLLLGKAWVVYFPAPFALNDAGEYPVVPDFGRLRFIR